MNENKERQKITAQIFDNVKKKKWTCIFPGCNNPAINSHLLQKNGILNSVAENGHLIEMKRMDVFKWDPDKAPLDFRRVGINEAFSLSLFCNHHDTSIFKEIESDTTDFSKYKSQLLLSYRVLCSERRKKEINAEIYRRLLQSRLLEGQYDKDVMEAIIQSNELGIGDLKKYQAAFEYEFDDLKNAFVFSTHTYPLIKVYGSAIFSPIDYGSVDPGQEQPLNGVFIHIIPYRDQLNIVVGNHSEYTDSWIESYRDSWRDLSATDLEFMITNLFAARIENWGLSPKLYQGIRKETRDKFLDYHRQNVPNLAANQKTDFNLFEGSNYG